MRKSNGVLKLIVLLTSIILALTSCSPASNPVPAPEYWPTESWQSADPIEHGFDRDALEKVDEAIATELPFLDCILIIRNGYIVHERYYNGYSANRLHNLASVTKSWTSAAVGLARAQGDLTDITAYLPSLLPMYFEDGQHADKREITLEHLLTMRSGIAFDDNIFVMGGYGGVELLDKDLTEFALDFPMGSEPGETWNYSTLDSQLLSAVIEVVAGKSVETLVSRELFAPMGIKNYEWSHDATGTTIGGGSLSLTPRDMAKLGFLYLHGGQWEAEQLVPEEWVQLSVTPQNSPAYYRPSENVENIEWYGHHWWTWKPDWFHGYASFEAKGYGGQQVLVLPELDLIIVTTAVREGLDPETAEKQESEIYALIHDTVLPGLEQIDPKN